MTETMVEVTRRGERKQILKLMTLLTQGRHAVERGLAAYSAFSKARGFSTILAPLDEQGELDCDWSESGRNKTERISQ